MEAETILLRFIRVLNGSLHVTFKEANCAAWLHDLFKTRASQGCWSAIDAKIAWERGKRERSQGWTRSSRTIVQERT
jgi:hypothetical protein